MGSFEKTAIVICIVALLVCPRDTRAQRIYVTDNATQSGNPAFNVKVFENGFHKYIVADAQGVTFSPRAVGFDSTGGLYIMSYSGGGVARVIKYTESDDGTEVFEHTQHLSSFGGTGGLGTCRWAVGDPRQLDVDLNDDTVVVADANGVWNTSCPSPGGRGPGSYGCIIRYDGADPTPLPGVELLGSHTVGLGIQGLAWIAKSGARQANNPVVTIDQVTGDVYVGSGSGSAITTTQVIEKFSRDFVQLDRWDVNDPARGVPANVTNLMMRGLAVTSDGSVWFNDAYPGAGMGGWGSPMGSIIKFDSSGQFVTRRNGATIVTGSTRNFFAWTGGMDVDEHDVLYYGDSDRIITLSGDNGDFIGFPVGDTAGQNDTNIYGNGAFTLTAGSLEQLAVGPEPAVGSSLRIF